MFRCYSYGCLASSVCRRSFSHTTLHRAASKQMAAGSAVGASSGFSQTRDVHVTPAIKKTRGTTPRRSRGSSELPVPKESRGRRSAVSTDGNLSVAAYSRTRGCPVAVHSSLYYVEEDMAHRDASEREDQLKAEKQGIAKLLVISQSVGSIFCALPGVKSVEEFVKEMDAVHVEEGTELKPSQQFLDYLTERVLVEEHADHQFCIHVRDMEQLVPPEVLTAPTTGTGSSCSSDSTSTGSSGGGGARPKTAGRKSLKKGSLPAAEPMTPFERMKALHRWRFDALRRSELSLKRFAVPSNVHAITRLRLHEPAKVDVTVVQSCGSQKKPEDVLAALNRFTKGRAQEQEPGVHKEEEEVMKAVFLAAFTHQHGNDHQVVTSLGSLGLISPFALKPLLTVYASCLPRRESQIGEIVDEEAFLVSDSAIRSQQKRRKVRRELRLPAGSMPRLLSKAKAKSYLQLLTRNISPVPKHTTRLTLLIEHNDLEVGDLVSLAEMSTPRKVEERPAADGAQSNDKPSKPRIYCLIQDGGKV